MISYTKRNINFISLIITIIIFIFTQFLQYFLFKNNFNFSILNPFYKNSIQVKMKETENIGKINLQNDTNKLNEAEHKNIGSEEQKKEESEWKVKIPNISLEAEIAEGTEENTLDNYVGHFVETPKTKGNIGLAAHNRGYKNNYFSKLKELKEGDEIYYQYKEVSKIYLIKEHKIIEDTDWTCLENTEENQLTLITCVENEPNYRRCIQAIEKSNK